MADDPEDFRAELLDRLRATGLGGIGSAQMRFRLTNDMATELEAAWLEVVNQAVPLVDEFLEKVEALTADRRRRDALVRATNLLIDAAPPELLERIEGALDAFHAAMPEDPQVVH